MKKDRETYWRSIIDQQAGSSLSIPVFCREHSISQWNFYQWRKRLTRKEARGFLELQVPSSFSNTHNTVGLRIRVFVFWNRRRNMVKLLYWERDGFVIF